MPSKVQLNVVSAPRTPNEFWLFDTLFAKVGDTVQWESAGREVILFIPSNGLFEEQETLPEPRVFEIKSPKFHLELKLRADLGQPGETIMIPYAAFCLPAGADPKAEMRAKMIIKR